VFGANGFVIGPVIAALFVAVWEIFAASRAAAPADTVVLAAPAAINEPTASPPSSSP
jgi:hypothetical protein